MQSVSRLRLKLALLVSFNCTTSMSFRSSTRVTVAAMRGRRLSLCSPILMLAFPITYKLLCLINEICHAVRCYSQIRNMG